MKEEENERRKEEEMEGGCVWRGKERKGGREAGRREEGKMETLRQGKENTCASDLPPSLPQQASSLYAE